MTVTSPSLHQPELNQAAIPNSVLGEKISVCLLTFNHVNVIGSTLKSIANQTISGYEVIVSDDSSTDGTWERILEIAKTNDRIRPVRTPRNLGMPGNANFAVAQSERPYIALLHHDDLYRQDLLEKWACVLERHEDISFVFNPYDDSTPELTYGPRLRQERIEGPVFLEKWLLPRWGCPVRGTAMIRRLWWDQVGGMRTRFDLLADVDLWMRLSMVSNVGYVAEPLISVRAMRPDYYPEIYKGSTFNWRRQVLSYEIFVSNTLSYFPLSTLQGRLKWWMLRVRLSGETAKWLLYGIVRAKRRHEILAKSAESVTPYDLLPLRIFRRMVQLVTGQSQP